jgi:ABC-type branched-subunit amino acid transport system permease subunit
VQLVPILIASTGAVVTHSTAATYWARTIFAGLPVSQQRIVHREIERSDLHSHGTIQIILNGLIAAAIYALIAIGFSVIYRTVRFFHFAHGVVYAAGAYAAYSLIIQLGMNPIAGFFLPWGWRE